MDLLNRFKHGEFYHADSIKFNDSLKYKTSKGRVVYGGGGIMPDVFVPRDTSEYSDYLVKVSSKNILREFALNYYFNHKKQLGKMSLEQYRKNFTVTEDMLQQIIKKANAEKIAFNQAEFDRSKHLIQNTIKAFIARSLYQSEGFFPVLHEADEEFQAAMKQFARAERLAQGKAD